MSRPLVSVVIATCDRPEAVLRAVESVRAQTWRAVEIIVVDDGSTDAVPPAKRPGDVRWIELSPSSRQRLGYPAPGVPRNVGIRAATGPYIAALDDDDLWLPHKLERQMAAMLRGGHEMSSTEAFIGDGPYRPGARYPVYHREHYGAFCARFFGARPGGWQGRLPDLLDRATVRATNFVIHSSVVLSRGLLDRAGLYDERIRLHAGRQPGGLAVDHDLWLRCLALTDCLHIDEPLIYYDGRLSDPNRIPSSKAI